MKSMDTARHHVAKELGRRVSRGEFERLTTRYTDVIVFVQSNSKGKQTGAPRTVRLLDRHSPRSLRKHADCYGKHKHRRVRYATD